MLVVGGLEIGGIGFGVNMIHCLSPSKKKLRLVSWAVRQFYLSTDAIFGFWSKFKYNSSLINLPSRQIRLETIINIFIALIWAPKLEKFLWPRKGKKSLFSHKFCIFMTWRNCVTFWQEIIFFFVNANNFIASFVFVMGRNFANL